MSDTTPNDTGASEDDESRTSTDPADTTEQADDADVPSDDELDEPSTEKGVAEEPRATKADDAEPDHEAIGIGVIEGQQAP